MRTDAHQPKLSGKRWVEKLVQHAYDARTPDTPNGMWLKSAVRVSERGNKQSPLSIHDIYVFPPHELTDKTKAQAVISSLNPNNWELLPQLEHNATDPLVHDEIRCNLRLAQEQALIWAGACLQLQSLIYGDAKLTMNAKCLLPYYALCFSAIQLIYVFCRNAEQDHQEAWSYSCNQLDKMPNKPGQLKGNTSERNKDVTKLWLAHYQDLIHPTLRETILAEFKLKSLPVKPRTDSPFEQYITPWQPLWNTASRNQKIKNKKSVSDPVAAREFLDSFCQAVAHFYEPWAKDPKRTAMWVAYASLDHIVQLRNETLKGGAKKYKAKQNPHLEPLLNDTIAKDHLVYVRDNLTGNLAVYDPSSKLKWGHERLAKKTIVHSLFSPQRKGRGDDNIQAKLWECFQHYKENLIHEFIDEQLAPDSLTDWVENPHTFTPSAIQEAHVEALANACRDHPLLTARSDNNAKAAANAQGEQNDGEGKANSNEEVGTQARERPDEFQDTMAELLDSKDLVEAVPSK